MGQLEIIVGNDKYPTLELPPEASTVGSFLTLVAQGLLGEKILYAEKLTCHGVEHLILEGSVSPPSPMRVSGPRSILGMFQIALKKKVGAPKTMVENVRIQPKPKKKAGWPYLGKYHVIRTIGSGFTGPCVYEAMDTVSSTKVALKWPAHKEEAAILKEIAEKSEGGCRGIPKLLGNGRYENRHFVVMELFREPLQRFFPRIWAKPRQERWQVTSLLGRLLLRRLEGMHGAGFVHCDLSPENVLLGRHGSTEYDPHILDFGLARKYPGAGSLAGEHGSGEWSSINSAEGGERRPEDDLEALGWLLMNCMHSVLPWFAVLENAYESWHIPAKRVTAVKQVQSMKRAFMVDGWKSVGFKWCEEQPPPPEELLRFIWSSRVEVTPPERPDYAKLAGILGASPDLDADAAEAEELRQWHLAFPSP